MGAAARSAGPAAEAPGGQGHRRAGGQRRHSTKNVPPNTGSPGAAGPGRDRAHPGGQSGAGVDDGPWLASRARGEDDDRVAVVVGVFRCRPAATGDRPRRAPGQPPADRHHRPEAAEIGQRQVGAAGQRCRPAGDRLGGGVGHHQPGRARASRAARTSGPAVGSSTATRRPSRSPPSITPAPGLRAHRDSERVAGGEPVVVDGAAAYPSASIGDLAPRGEPCGRRQGRRSSPGGDRCRGRKRRASISRSPPRIRGRRGRRCRGRDTSWAARDQPVGPQAPGGVLHHHVPRVHDVGGVATHPVEESRGRSGTGGGASRRTRGRASAVMAMLLPACIRYG